MRVHPAASFLMIMLLERGKVGAVIARAVAVRAVWCVPAAAEPVAEHPVAIRPVPTYMLRQSVCQSMHAVQSNRTVITLSHFSLQHCTGTAVGMCRLISRSRWYKLLRQMLFLCEIGVAIGCFSAPYASHPLCCSNIQQAGRHMSCRYDLKRRACTLW